MPDEYCVKMGLTTLDSQESPSSSKIITYSDSQGSWVCKDPNFGIHKDPGSEEPTKFQILEDMGLRKLMRVVDMKNNRRYCCVQRAAYVYSLDHVVHGDKKVRYKKKFQFSCCFASSFGSNSSPEIVVASVLLQSERYRYVHTCPPTCAQ